MVCLADAETEAAWHRQQRDAPDDWEKRVRAGAQTDGGNAADLGDYTCEGSLPELEVYLEWLRQRALGWTGRPLAEGEATRRPQRGGDARRQGRRPAVLDTRDGNSRCRSGSRDAAPAEGAEHLARCRPALAYRRASPYGWALRRGAERRRTTDLPAGRLDHPANWPPGRCPGDAESNALSIALKAVQPGLHMFGVVFAGDPKPGAAGLTRLNGRWQENR